MKFLFALASAVFTLSTPLKAGFFDKCIGDCQVKDVCAGEAPDLRGLAYSEASRLEAYFSEFSASFDRFRNGSEQSDVQRQQYEKIADEIIQSIARKPEVMRYFSLPQITSFFQRVTLDSERTDAIENLWITLEPVFNQYIEDKLVSRHTWQTPLDAITWKLGIQTANDLLYLIKVRNQYIRPTKITPFRSFRSHEHQIIRDLRLGSRLIWMKNPEAIHNLFKPNDHLTSHSHLNSNLYEPVYGRYGISGEIIWQEYKKVRNHSLFEGKNVEI